MAVLGVEGEVGGGGGSHFMRSRSHMTIATLAGGGRGGQGGG